MLSEIRAYGQGVLIAEQIPAKLAPDAIKNTNLKLMQRIVAADDRQALGSAMNLDERQSRFVASLQVGQGVAYAEGADRPYLLQIPIHPAKQAGSQKLTNRQVKNVMAQALTSSRYDPVPGYSHYLAGGLSPHLRDLALQITTPPAFCAHFQRYFLSAWLNPAYAIQGYGTLLKLIQQETANHKLAAAELTQLAVAVLLHALDDLFAFRGRGYNWLYNVTATMRNQAAESLAQIGAANGQPSPQLMGQVQAKLKQFETGYRQQTRRKDGPFTGCIFCGQKCLYRFEAAPLSADKTMEQDFIAAINHNSNAEAMWQALADVSLRAADAMVDAAPPATQQELALCFAVQISAAQNFGTNNERKLAQSVRIKLTGK